MSSSVDERTIEERTIDLMNGESLLHTMLLASQSPLHIDEIIRLELSGAPLSGGRVDRVRVLLDELASNGLVHQLNGFYWPSQAARALGEFHLNQ